MVKFVLSMNGVVSVGENESNVCDSDNEKSLNNVESSVGDNSFFMVE